MAPAKVLRTAPALLILGATAAVPFLYGKGLTRTHNAVQTFAVSTAALVAAAAGLHRSNPARHGEGSLDRSGVYAPFALVGAWGMVSLFWHDHPWTAAAGLATPALLVAGSWGLSFLFMDPRFRRWFAIAYGIACAGAATAFVAAHGDTPAGPGHTYPFGNPNIGASFLLLPLVATAAFALEFRRRRYGPGLLVATPVLAATVLALAWTRAKGAWLAGAIGVTLALAIQAPTRRARAAVAVGFAILALGASSWLAANEHALRDLERSARVRWEMWRGAWDLVTADPISFVAGRGWGSYLVESGSHEPLAAEASPEWSAYNDDPHNLVLGLWCEGGLAAVGLFAGFCAAVAIATSRGLALVTDPFDRTLLVAASAGLAAMLLAGMVDVAPRHPLPQWQMGIALALVAALASRTDSEVSAGEPGLAYPARVRRLGLLTRAGWILVLGALWGLSEIPQLASEIWHHRAIERESAAREIAMRGDVDLARIAYAEAVSAYERALERAPWESARTLELRRDLAWALLARAGIAGDPARRRGYLTRAYREIDRVASPVSGLAPRWGALEVELAEIALALGDPSRARERLAGGWTRRPVQWRFYWCYLRNWEAIDSELARADLLRNLARGLRAAPDFALLVAASALVQDRMGDPRARATLERADELARTEPRYVQERDSEEILAELRGRLAENSWRR